MCVYEQLDQWFSITIKSRFSLVSHCMLAFLFRLNAKMKKKNSLYGQRRQRYARSIALIFIVYWEFENHCGNAIGWKVYRRVSLTVIIVLLLFLDSMVPMISDRVPKVYQVVCSRAVYRPESWRRHRKVYYIKLEFDQFADGFIFTKLVAYWNYPKNLFYSGKMGYIYLPTMYSVYGSLFN